MTDETHPYKLGRGHVLATGHDPSSCLACAYDRGRSDERDENESARFRSALKRISQEAGRRHDLGDGGWRLARIAREALDANKHEKVPATEPSDGQ